MCFASHCIANTHIFSNLCLNAYKCRYCSAPEIITTAPTVDFSLIPQKKTSRLKLTNRIRQSSELPSDARSSFRRQKKEDRKSISDLSHYTDSHTMFEEPPPIPESAELSRALKHTEPLGLPGARLSESSTSSIGDGIFGGSGHSGRGVSGSTGFFRLPRRKPKQPEPLFALSHLPQRSKGNVPSIPRTSSSSLHVGPGKTTTDLQHNEGTIATQETSRPPSDQDGTPSMSQSPPMPVSSKSTMSPATALFRPGSVHSAQSSPTRARLALRGRSSTMSSAGRDSIDDHLSPPTGRSSISTGRKSFGDLLGLGRFRQNSDYIGTKQGTIVPIPPGSNTSKNNSLQLQRECVPLPERREDDNPAKYLARVEEVMTRSVIASSLSKGNDPFYQAVLRSYMRKFAFFGDPMDMAIRKLLMEAELPKETQQIDRCLQSFANRYHECNPGIYSSPDQAYFIAFSLLILHTDVFNRNNKYKMQKTDYLKNTHGEGVFDEILECFYDNITYTPFIHVEDEFDMLGERVMVHKPKRKSIFPNTVSDSGGKKMYKEPIDPYSLILDKKLEILRPNLKDIMELEEHFSYLGTAPSLNLSDLQKTFFRTGVLQIISARSRPDAFMTEKTANNPDAAHPGIVDIKITKVGLLWRKDSKKKKTRSPWQEWGAILTGAQLYFFRNVGWVKNLIHQYENHVKQGNDGIPCIFKPPLEDFKPDSLMSTDGAVALVDSTYRKHKHAFVYVRKGGLEEVLLADNEDELNDWLAKLNYAAAFRTSGVRMRGVVGGHYEGQSRRGFRRLDSSDGTQSVQTPTGEVTIARGRIDHKMAQDILAARRDMMEEKIDDANEKIEEAHKQLSAQLRNARHLHILAPIQQKTREAVLVSAHRFANSLKRTRVDMWRLKCHRDILQLDLDEEQRLTSLPPMTPPRPSSYAEHPTLSPKDTNPSQLQVHTKKRSQSLTSHPIDIEHEELAGSPATEIFQTPPSSATMDGFHKQQPSHELSPIANADPKKLRANSVSSTTSSVPGLFATPPRTAVPIDSTPSNKVPKQEMGDSEDVDADERRVLQQAGLLSSPTDTNIDSRSINGDTEDSQSRLKERPGSASADKGDKGKIRRSLHRTVREGVGHLSHHRGRRTRDSVSSCTTVDDTAREEMLVRGSGSFVVHGKKASVINFGSELQSISPEGRLKQRKSHREVLGAVGASSFNTDTVIVDDEYDYQSVIWERNNLQTRRESAASASTATARSFRELHRKYSSAQASRVHASGLVVPSDDDSDAAISFSDGRRTPLPPIEGEPELEAEAVKKEGAVNGGNTQNAKKQAQHEEKQKDKDNCEHRSQYFTPEEPSSPVESESGQNRPTIQSVTA